MLRFVIMGLIVLQVPWVLLSVIGVSLSYPLALGKVTDNLTGSRWLFLDQIERGSCRLPT